MDALGARLELLGRLLQRVEYLSLEPCLFPPSLNSKKLKGNVATSCLLCTLLACPSLLLFRCFILYDACHLALTVDVLACVTQSSEVLET